MKTELEQMKIRTEVLTEQLSSLNQNVSELSEEMSARFDAVDARFREAKDETNAQFAELKKLVTDGHSVLISAVMNLGRR